MGAANTKLIHNEPALDEHDLKVPDKTKSKFWDKKLQLIKKIERSVGIKSSGKRNLNIVVIGTPGCGKSSFINTVMTSFKIDKWNQFSKEGSSDRHNTSITKHFKSFQSAITYYIEKPRILLPTFIDIHGLQDNDNDFNKAFLRALFDGKIKENEQHTRLHNKYTKNPHEFKKEMENRRQHLKVDRIIVVETSDPNQPLAKNLYKCVRKVADDMKGIPIFGVMTKKDLFEQNKDFSARKREFLGSIGISENSFKCINNYCPDIDINLRYHETVYAHIDVPVLRFINQVLNPFRSSDYPDFDLGRSGKWIVKIVSLLSRFIQILIWLFVFVMITTIFNHVDNNTDFCTAYAKMCKTYSFTLPYIDRFCRDDKYGGYYLFSLPIAISLLLFGIPSLVRIMLRSEIKTMLYITLLLLCICLQWIIMIKIQK